MPGRSAVPSKLQASATASFVNASESKGDRRRIEVHEPKAEHDNKIVLKNPL